MENTEIWASIAGYERYQVSTYGRVWDKEKDREVPQFINDRGYKIVDLMKNKKESIVSSPKHSFPTPTISRR